MKTPENGRTAYEDRTGVRTVSERIKEPAYNDLPGNEAEQDNEPLFVLDLEDFYDLLMEQQEQM